MKKYIIVTTVAEWKNGTGWSWNEDLDADYITDDITGIKSDNYDWGDITGLDTGDADYIKACADDSETDVRYTVTAYAEDDEKRERPLCKCTTWLSDIAKDYLAV